MKALEFQRTWNTWAGIDPIASVTQCPVEIARQLEMAFLNLAVE